MLESLTDFVAAGMDDERHARARPRGHLPRGHSCGRCQSEDLGIQLVFLPEAYGGMGGGAFDSYRVCEAMARKTSAWPPRCFATFLGSDPILVGATEEQKETWLGRIAEEGIVFAYGATEPEAGSDLGALTTTATPVEDDDGRSPATDQRRKQWISNGTIADASTILALAPRAARRGSSSRRARTASPAAPPEDKHGIRLSNTAALFLDDVEVPVENLVGGVEGQGLVQAQQVFGYTRLMVAAFGLGGGWEAIDRAIEYSVNRIQGGAPLSQKQGYTHKLIVPHVVRLEAARAHIEETATRIDAARVPTAPSTPREPSPSTWPPRRATRRPRPPSRPTAATATPARTLVEKIKRDVRITTIYEGTSEIMEMTIARDRWQHHLKTRATTT
jgi:alkylation response protein AidB-like acyl-CoA dehydrogenase